MIRKLSNLEIRNIFEGGTDGNPLPEMKRIYKALLPSENGEFLERLHNDITEIFTGNFQGFRQNKAKYHDLHHTRATAFATIRLFHGLQCESITLPPDIVKLTLLCAYFHDTGLLLTTKDPETTGSAHLKKHEKRSTEFACKYMSDRGYPKAYQDNCEIIINCTNLTIEPETLQFESKKIKLAGHILGTADILAQMGDRYYLECLPYLYQEQQDAGIHQHPSSISLMRQTTKFYHTVIERRLHESFNGIHKTMQSHFREWSDFNHNLYMDYIRKNIQYLEEVVGKYDSGMTDLSLYLRRQKPQV